MIVKSALKMTAASRGAGVSLPRVVATNIAEDSRGR
jgi:hypothetical protein